MRGGVPEGTKDNASHWTDLLLRAGVGQEQSLGSRRRGAGPGPGLSEPVSAL
jgi:hypothetical protein